MVPSDVVVLPSYYREWLPTVLLEAMALGKPIETTDNVGCRDVVEDGLNGYMVPVKDSAALARAIAKLLDQPELRRAFGRYGRDKAQRELDESVVLKRVIDGLYDVGYAQAKKAHA